MEDSEKRKQLLLAMRMEAASQNDDSTKPETSMNTGHLSNPLAETSANQQESSETPRFDYYTDPMSAYSSFKRIKTPKQQYISSPNHQISSPVQQLPPPAPGSLGSDYQAHTNHGSFQAAHYNGENLHTKLGGSPAAWNCNFRPPGPPPQVNHFGQPHWVPRPFPFRPDMGNNRFGGQGSYTNTTPQYPHYRQQNSNWVGNRYRGRGMNTSFGRDGGRRPMEQGAERFYSNSMAEDPWKYLKPIIWKNYSTGQTWLPNSIAPKKPEASQKPRNNQQPSLAEYLAASLDEVTCEPSN